jgi:hypothetical protein
MSTCHLEDCEEPTTLTMRFETDEGPEFASFCKGHLHVAVDFLEQVAEVQP